MFYNKTVKEIELELETSSTGLTEKQVKARQQRYGKNLLPKKKKDGILKIFFSEFKDPMIFLLLIALVASFAVGETIDAIAILLIMEVYKLLGRLVRKEKS